MTYRYILFDLDGTLADPKRGITKSAQYALARFGIGMEDLDELEHFIGPPLKDTFENIYGLSSDQVQRAILYYREYFSSQGIYENALYPGVETLLEVLRAQERVLGLATTKPTVFAKEILHHFNILMYFDVVSGGTLDDSISKKEDIVRQALDELSNPTPDKVVLVGDTQFDLIGAEQNGINFIGVTYGYGFRRDTDLSGQSYGRLVDTIEDLQKALLD